MILLACLGLPLVMLSPVPLIMQLAGGRFELDAGERKSCAAMLGSGLALILVGLL